MFVRNTKKKSFDGLTWSLSVLWSDMHPCPTSQHLEPKLSCLLEIQKVCFWLYSCNTHQGHVPVVFITSIILLYDVFFQIPNLFMFVLSRLTLWRNLSLLVELPFYSRFLVLHSFIRPDSLFQTDDPHWWIFRCMRECLNDFSTFTRCKRFHTIVKIASNVIHLYVYFDIFCISNSTRPKCFLTDFSERPYCAVSSNFVFP